ncbi:hypothetical protein ACLMJK_005553 [Lecanora helva]
MPSFFFHIALDLDDLSWAGFATQNEGDLNGSTSPPTSQTIDAELHGNRIRQNEGLIKDASHALLTADWRYDKISMQDINMTAASPNIETRKRDDRPDHITDGISSGSGGLATKGRYKPLDPQQEEIGWGVVRLYKDNEETPGLYDQPEGQKPSRHGKHSTNTQDEDVPFHDEDCTTLCILAVPSYLTPSDFLGFVGEKTRNQVSHFRMIKTERGNRYMVLIKFRKGKEAREWRSEWNGKPFDGMEPENCHVVFVKSIEFRTHELPGQEGSFPDMSNDPFTPSSAKASQPPSTSSNLQAVPMTSGPRSIRPHAPPTPALVELPTCPVCLERMDESTGLLTILCQHVFHCSCLQKWRGSGCPVCRYTQDDVGSGKRIYSNINHGEDTGLNECSVCRSEVNLWICLVCGNVGCGRYDAAHAFSHYEQSQHCFAMDMTTQRIWDYGSDAYVHRIVQNKTDGKLVELTPSTTPRANPYDDDFDDYVPREKLDNVGLEYTHLLTSQLDSQRMYFEEILERAADKAAQAALTAAKSTESSSKNAKQLESLRVSYDKLANELIPSLEKDRDRATRKAEKFETMARKLEKEWRDEKAMNDSLMSRIKHLETQLEKAQVDNANLEEEKRDLSFFISGMEKLKTSGVDEEELKEGTVSLPEVANGGAKGKGKKKGGGKGKK